MVWVCCDVMYQLCLQCFQCHQRLFSDGLITDKTVWYRCQSIHSKIRISRNPVKNIYHLPIGWRIKMTNPKIHEQNERSDWPRGCVQQCRTASWAKSKEWLCRVYTTADKVALFKPVSVCKQLLKPEQKWWRQLFLIFRKLFLSLVTYFRNAVKCVMFAFLIVHTVASPW